MGNERRGAARAASPVRELKSLQRIPVDEPSPVGLVALPIESLDEEGRVATLLLGSERIQATLDPALSVVVAKTATDRGERVIAQREAEGWVVLGALRTAPTPGIDAAEEYVIEAKRVVVKAAHELTLVSGAARLALRAYGYIESVAQDINTRASGVHKIVGRMIRLN